MLEVERKRQIACFALEKAFALLIDEFAHEKPVVRGTAQMRATNMRKLVPLKGAAVLHAAAWECKADGLWNVLWCKSEQIPLLSPSFFQLQII